VVLTIFIVCYQWLNEINIITLHCTACCAGTSQSVPWHRWCSVVMFTVHTWCIQFTFNFILYKIICRTCRPWHPTAYMPYYCVRSVMRAGTYRSFSRPLSPLRCLAKSPKSAHAHWVVGKCRTFRNDNALSKLLHLPTTLCACADFKIYWQSPSDWPDWVATITIANFLIVACMM
jgi:hypothetical protein